MNAEAARLNNVLPLGQQPEGNILEMEKFEKAMKNLFLNIDKLKLNLKILKEKNIKLEKLVDTLENKNGHK